MKGNQLWPRLLIFYRNLHVFHFHIIYSIQRLSLIFHYAKNFYRENEKKSFLDSATHAGHISFIYCTAKYLVFTSLLMFKINIFNTLYRDKIQLGSTFTSYLIL